MMVIRGHGNSTLKITTKGMSDCTNKTTKNCEIFLCV